MEDSLLKWSQVDFQIPTALRELRIGIKGRTCSTANGFTFANAMEIALEFLVNIQTHQYRRQHRTCVLLRELFDDMLPHVS